MVIEKRLTGLGPRYHAREDGKKHVSETLRGAKTWAAKTFLESLEGPQPTMRDLAPGWLEDLRVNRSKVHWQTQTRIVKAHWGPYLNLYWYETRKSVVLGVLKSKELTNPVRNSIIKSLVMCLNSYVRIDELPYNPLDKIQMFGHNPALPRVPEEHEIDRVFEYAENHYPERILALDTILEGGFRVGEILDTKLRPPGKWLMWEHCLLQQDPPLLVVFTRKTGNSDWREDKMPISQELATRLKEWKLRGLHDGEYVFPWTYSAMKRWLRKCCIAAGVDPFGFHSIRHFFSHHLMNRDVSDKKIQGALRHKSIQTTQRYLQNLKPAHDLVEHRYVRKMSQRPPKTEKGGTS